MKPYIFAFVLICFLTSCGPAKRTEVIQNSAELNGRASTIDLVNQKLESDVALVNRREYRIGGGDVIDVLVYLVDDVSRTYQVNSNGDIQMPLVGAVMVGGKTVVEAQNEITASLAKSFVKNPQVTISISEYSANEISVLGEVSAAKIYSVKEGRNPFEMLVMAGGLKKTAGPDIHISTKMLNPETNRYQQVKTVVDLQSIFDPETPEDYETQKTVKNIILGDGDSLYIPAAGLVYIDGAIKSPGSYDMQNDTTILSLLALAGGAEWTSSARKVKVLRKVDRTSNQEFNLDLNKIRNNELENFKLQSGDLVLVGHNSFKYGLKAFWEYGLRFLFIL